MHIHTTAATPAGDSLAGFQAAQTASALRRARELGDAAARIKARSQGGGIEEDTASFASLMAAIPAAQSTALSQASQTVGSIADREPQTNHETNHGLNASPLNAPQDFYTQSDLPSPRTFPLVSSEAASRASPATQSPSVSPFFQFSAGVDQNVSYASSSNTGNSNHSSPNDWLRPISFWA